MRARLALSSMKRAGLPSLQRPTCTISAMSQLCSARVSIPLMRPPPCELATRNTWPRGRTYHSEAEVEAALRGLAAELAEFQRETSAVADALTCCDLTTSAVGMLLSFQERIADIFRRYDEASIVAQAISLAQPALARVIERVQQGDSQDESRRISPP